MFKIIAFTLLAGTTLLANAHSGRVDSNGGHYDRSTNEYHCMRESCTTSMQDSRVVVSPSQSTTKAGIGDGKYVRSEWMSRWPRVKGTCRDLRHDMLMKDSKSAVTFKTTKQCRVVAGVWHDPYSDMVLYKPKAVDIDHIISLKYANNIVGKSWSKKKKKAFATDPINLWVVSAKHNRSKGSKGPSKWLPKNSLCEYHDAWISIADKYQLEIPAKDMKKLNEVNRYHCIGK